MDAQTRHAMKQNELAEAISSLGDSLKSGSFQRWSVLVLLGLAALVAWRVWSWTSARAKDQAWADLMATLRSTSEPDRLIQALREHVDTNGDPQQAAAARLILANLLMERGLEEPARTQERTAEAANVLAPVAMDSKLAAQFVAPAMYRLASASETLGKFEDARRYYQQLVDDQRFDGSPYRKQAADRMKDLDSVAKIGDFLAGMPPAASQAAGMESSTPIGPEPIVPSVESSADETPSPTPASEPAAAPQSSQPAQPPSEQPATP